MNVKLSQILLKYEIFEYFNKLRENNIENFANLVIKKAKIFKIYIKFDKKNSYFKMD